MKKQLEPLVFEVTEKINKLEIKDKITLSDPEKISFENLISSKRDVFNKLAKSFNLYNKKWNLCNFSENDFKLFLLFTDLQLFFKENITLM